MEQNGIYISNELLKILILIMSTFFSISVGIITFFLTGLIRDLKASDSQLLKDVQEIKIEVEKVKTELKAFKDGFD